MPEFAWDRKRVIVADARRSVSVPLDAEGIDDLTSVLESRLQRFFTDGRVAVVLVDGEYQVHFHELIREWTLDRVQEYADRILAGVDGDAKNGWTIGDEMEHVFNRTPQEPQGG
ncbi:hypothetical protein AB0L40_05315 [Patulibacter sp. NPDC049589]|uniref:hypothetical protein n=1 Tax=Patulibacter sp. NPDC049589 TaxID=3154731 RepID=UPI003423BE56